MEAPPTGSSDTRQVHLNVHLELINPFSPNALPMTQQSVFEPLLIVNPSRANPYPGSGHRGKDKDGKGVTFTIRDGVKWSDGQPMTAEDVCSPSNSRRKSGGFEYCKVRGHADPSRFDSTSPSHPDFTKSAAGHRPEAHLVQHPDPANDTNPKPVGTGPYTEVNNFQTQSFQLCSNPNYWQPDKQKIQGVQLLAFAGNDPANLATTNGETDWADQFIPDVKNAFVAKDPEHRHFWFPPLDSTINWQVNTTKAPFDNVDVRKALSMAVGPRGHRVCRHAGLHPPRGLHRADRRVQPVAQRKGRRRLRLDDPQC